jgi:hypothetical protein
VAKRNETYDSVTLKELNESETIFKFLQQTLQVCSPTII